MPVSVWASPTPASPSGSQTLAEVKSVLQALEEEEDARLHAAPQLQKPHLQAFREEDSTRQQSPEPSFSGTTAQQR